METGPWTPEEDQRLKVAANKILPLKYCKNPWVSIAAEVGTRNRKQCCKRWNDSLSLSKKRGCHWTLEEDEIIRAFVAVNGPIKWSELATMLPGRTGRQCRNRWINCLDPSINKSHFTPEEDKLLLELYKRFEGFKNKWKEMSRYFNRRNSLRLKNRYDSLKKYTVM